LNPDDKILSLYAAGYSTGRLRDCGQIHFLAGTGWAAGGSPDSPCEFRLKTVLAGAGVTLSDRLIIDVDGLATFSHGAYFGDDIVIAGNLNIASTPGILTINTMPMTATLGGSDGNTWSFASVDTIQLGKSQSDANQRGFLFRKLDGSAGGGMYLSGLDGTPLWRLFVGGEAAGNLELSITDAGASFSAALTAVGVGRFLNMSGGTGQIAIGIPNGTSLCGKTSGGTACDLVMLYTDDVLYIGDANVSGGISIQSSKNAFFGGAPVSKPTGVAVSAVAIHAALVTLNLIAA
jgi:hypothetical protein